MSLSTFKGVPAPLKKPIKPPLVGGFRAFKTPSICPRPHRA
jgi:hypothetical protein